MAVELSHRRTGFVLTIHDPAELPALGLVAAKVSDGLGTSVVVDVSEMTVAPQEDARKLVDAVCAAAAASGGRRWALVATRLSARRVLRALCADSAVGVYPSVDVALAANGAA